MKPVSRPPPVPAFSLTLWSSWTSCLETPEHQFVWAFPRGGIDSVVLIAGFPVTWKLDSEVWLDSGKGFLLLYTSYFIPSGGIKGHRQMISDTDSNPFIRELIANSVQFINGCVAAWPHVHWPPVIVWELANTVISEAAAMLSVWASCCKECSPLSPSRGWGSVWRVRACA